MRIQRMFYLLAAVLVAELALAKMPFTNEVFGKVEGTLDYCARIDSQATAKYEKRKKDLVKDVPEEEVAAARKTEDYKTGYEWISNELPKMSKEEVLGACAATLVSNN
jgi:hypothetical protein